MNVIALLLVFQYIALYHCILLGYTLAYNYNPESSKVTQKSFIFKVISKTFNSNQNHILLTLTLFASLSLSLVTIKLLFIQNINILVYSIIALFVLNLFASIHSKLIHTHYFKTILQLLTPLLITLYAVSLPFFIACKHRFFSHKQISYKKATLKDFFSSSLNELKDHLCPNDKSLIESICLFDSLEARQIMIPKVDMFCLDQETSIYNAAKNCIHMGFSRIPVYKKKVDNIHAVLLFKDLLKASLNLSIQEQKETTIKGYTSAIIFSPETKKIKDLFQEIKKQRIHASIIINEYGCTEGLVTMEDILEELLGSEILDESDVDEEILFIPIKDNCWIVNPKMSIIDARKHLDLDLKDSSEYETITGYIFSKMGAIPKPGACIQEDSFHINVLKSDQRKISKIKITKVSP